MSFTLDPSRVIPATRLPVVRLPDDVSRRIQDFLAGGKSIERIALPVHDPANDSLGPVSSGDPSSNTDAAHLRAEFKVDGKVIARVFDSGDGEFAGGYDHLASLAGFGTTTGDGKVGPELADARIAKLTDLLKATPAGSAGESAPATEPRMKFSDCVVALAASPVTQAQWLAAKAGTVGTILSVEA